MFRSRHIAAVCGVVLSLAAPAAALAQQDLRSPDARDAAATHQPATPAQQILTDQQRAIVDRYKRSQAYQATLREVRAANAQQRAQVASGNGLDWVDAGIGAAGMLAIGLIALGGVLAVTHRRPAATR